MTLDRFSSENVEVLKVSHLRQETVTCPQKYSLTGLCSVGVGLHANGSQVIGSPWVCVVFACVRGFVCRRV